MDDIKNTNALAKSATWLSVAIFVCIQLFFLQNDYWQDEIYTLKHFVFAPLVTTATDYHSTNNHILFNLVNNLVRHLLGYKDVQSMFLHPYLLRCVPIVTSFLTIIFFYKKTKKEYGQYAALLGTSILATTFPYICFASQFRGYSLAIFIVTLQYFSFLKALRQSNLSIFTLLRVALFSLFSLLCLPTNLYIELSYLLLCFLLFVFPNLSTVFIGQPIKKANLIKISLVVMLTSICLVAYYKRLLFLHPQPETGLLTTFHLFSITNFLQSFSILYRFSGYRFYLCLIVALAIIAFYIKRKKATTNYFIAALPLFLFLAVFFFFFVHGAIIIQRTFLSLIPFFALFCSLSLQYFVSHKYFKTVFTSVLFLNVVCIVARFSLFVVASKQNNATESRVQNLVEHYYLIGYNALPVSLLAKQQAQQKNEPIFLYDHGSMGIDFYLNELNIPYQPYQPNNKLPQHFIIITNKKTALTNDLHQQKINFTKIGTDEDQFNLFISQ